MTSTVLDSAALVRIWPDVLRLTSGRSKKVVAVVREASALDVRGNTLTLSFRHQQHANMLATSPGVLASVLQEMLGGDWTIKCDVAGGFDAPKADREDGSLSLCGQLSYGSTLHGNELGPYGAAVSVSELPPAVVLSHLIIEHGFAVGSGQWHFFAALPPAIAFGRAVRMSRECRGYGVFEAARETRHCLEHGDELLLHVRSGKSFDRSEGEAEHLDTWARGVIQHLDSSHWHPPTGTAVVPFVPPTRATAPETKPCAVYLHFDANDVLLYVGITDDPMVRGKQHASRSTWTQFVIRGEVVWCSSRIEAEQRETELIRERRPLFNDKHSAPDRDERLVAYLAGKGRYDLLSPAITRG